MRDIVQISAVRGYEWVADNLFYSVGEQKVFESGTDGERWYIGLERNGQIRLKNKDEYGCPFTLMGTLVSACVDYALEEEKAEREKVNVKINTLGGFHWVADNYYFSLTEEKLYYTDENGNRVYPVVLSHGMVNVVSGNNGRLYPISIGMIMKQLGMTPKPVEDRDEIPSNRGYIIGKLVNGAIRIARNPKTHHEEESCDKELDRLASTYPDVFFVKLAIRDVVVGKMETKVTISRL
jgi:hypothetical protein|nr:MAG TPA: hypothetical protein [Caudoviricetes sp.]